MAWPGTRRTLDLGYADDVTPEMLKGVDVADSCFKAPEGKFLPVLIDLYNGQRMQLPIVGTLVPLRDDEQPAHDLEIARASLVEARDIACQPLHGWNIEVEVGPAAGMVNRARAVALQATVVDDKRRVVFSLCSTV